MKIIKLATITMTTLAISTNVAGVVLIQHHNFHDSRHQYQLLAAKEQSEQPAGAEAGTFKRNDPDSIISQTHDSADKVDKPEPGAAPKLMVNKDPDSIICKADTAPPDTERPNPDATPETFQLKDHVGPDTTRDSRHSGSATIGGKV